MHTDVSQQLMTSTLNREGPPAPGHREVVICPYCLSRVERRTSREGLVLCRECGNAHAPLAGGGAAVPLPDHVVISTSSEHFAILVRGFFVTFGRARCDLSFQLYRARFSWSKPPAIGPLRFDDAACSVPRVEIAQFAWQRFQVEKGDGEVVSDLVLVKRDRAEVRAGFAFPPRHPFGPSAATLLQWAHEVWFEEGTAYRSPATEIQRPTLSVLRRDGRVEPLVG
jgi:hypothetical protein